MAWTTPITSNNPANKVTITTFDNIGANQVYLKERADVVDANQLVKTTDDVSFPNVTATTKLTTPTGAITTVNSTTINNSGTVNTANINTGNGAVECYAMDQPTRTTDNVTFNSVTTDNVAIKQKYFTGSFDGSGVATFSHGLNIDNILGVSVLGFNGTSFISPGALSGPSIYSSTTTTTTTISGGSSYANQPYRVVITYKA